MALFHYHLMDEKGVRTEGTLEAKDKFALYHAVKKEGITVVSAVELTGKASWSLFSSIPFLSSIGTHQKIIFARNLSKMIDAGLPIVRSLSVMEKEAKGEFKTVLHNISTSIAQGETLSRAMKQYPKVFSTLFVSMVSAGEESGNLSLALKNIALEIEKSYQLTRKIRGALMYPMVILSLMIVIGILMMVYMVPTLTATFKGLGLSLPLSTRIIIGTSDFLVAYFLYVIILILVLVGLFIWAIRTARGQRLLDSVLIKTPVIKEMVKEINSARTTRTLSSLLSSGVDIIVAIEVTRDVLQNSYYKKVLGEVQDNIQKGGSISSVFSAHTNLYPVFVSEMASVGEETGKIGEMLLSVALFYEEEIDQKTKDMSSIIEPLLMIFIGLAVGVFAISIISPIYSIGDSIN